MRGKNDHKAEKVKEKKRMRESEEDTVLQQGGCEF